MLIPRVVVTPVPVLSLEVTGSILPVIYYTDTVHSSINIKYNNIIDNVQIPHFNLITEKQIVVPLFGKGQKGH